MKWLVAELAGTRAAGTLRKPTGVGQWNATWWHAIKEAGSVFFCTIIRMLAVESPPAYQAS